MTTTAPDAIAAAKRARFIELTSHSDQRLARVKSAIFGWLYLLLSPVCVLFPVFTLRNVTYVLGHDDVRAVLSNAETFATPFHEAMAEVDRTGTVSLMGFERPDATPSERKEIDEEYRHNLCRIMRCLSFDDLPSLGHAAAAHAERLLRDVDEVDVVGGLLTPIVLDIAQKYFGLAFAQPLQFHRWTMALSNFTFSGSQPPDWLREAAELGGGLVGGVLDEAITSAMATGGHPNTLLGRLVSMSPGAGALKHNEIRATFAGLLSGMLPNIPIAGFNVLQVLLQKPRAMAAARAAAVSNNDEDLQRCIMEALRFRPIDPGRNRVCIADDRSALGRNGWRRGPIPVGRRVYAATLPAMFDGRRVRKPFRFDPSRAPSDNLALGAGKHWCVGAPLAMCLLTQTLKPLLCKPKIRRKANAPASTFFLGFFPESFTVELE